MNQGEDKVQSAVLAIVDLKTWQSPFEEDIDVCMYSGTCYSLVSACNIQFAIMAGHMWLRLWGTIVG
jgi:hypothetical protein